MPRLDRKKYDFDVLEHVFGGVRATSDGAEMSPIVCLSSIAPETLESEILIRVRVSNEGGSDQGEG